MQVIEIDKDQVLNSGDVVYLYFKAPGPAWMKAIECALVESAVENNAEFEIVSVDYWQPQRVIYEVEVQQTNPVLVTVGFIVAAILATAGLALAAGWMFEKAELLSKTPAAKIGVASLAIIAGLLVLSQIKK